MKKNITVLGALALVLLITACSNPLSPAKINTGGDEGTLIVQLGGEERTLAPSTLGELEYWLNIRQGNNILYNDWFDASANSFRLGIGTYEIWIGANSNGKTIASAWTDKIYIRAGETTKANLALKPAYDNDVPGFLSYSVSYPDPEDKDNEIGYGTRTIVLVAAEGPNTDSATIVLDGPVSEGVLELPPGIYNMTLTIQSNRIISFDSSPWSKQLSVVRQERVYIYPGLTTGANYNFELKHFTADVYYSGTARVEHASGLLNTDYVPAEVIVYNYYNEDVLSGEITKNEEGEYEWELFVPSHYYNIGGSSNELNLIKIQFKARHVDDPERVVIGGYQALYLENLHGRTGIDLVLKTTTLQFNKAILPAGADVIFNEDVGMGGWTEITIITPENYGLWGRTVRIDSNYAYDGYLMSEGGVITAGISVPNSVTPTLNLDFFRLVGTIYMYDAGYAPALIEAYEPGTGDDVLIGSAVPVKDLGSSYYDWAIPIPTGYIWGLESSSDYALLKTTSTATDKPDWTQENSVYIGYSSHSLGINPFAISGLGTERLNATTVRLHWNVAGWAASGYKVYLDGGTPTLLTATALAQNVTHYDYVDPAMVPGTNYSFLIAGQLNATTEGKRISTGITIYQLPPSFFYASGNKTGVFGSLQDVDLEWGAIAGAGYEIQRDFNNSWDWQTLYTTTDSSETAYNDNVFSSLPSSGNYIYYRIRALDSGGYHSGWSYYGVSAPYEPDVQEVYISTFDNTYDVNTSINASGEKIVLYIANTYNYWLRFTVDCGFYAKVTVYRNNGSTNLGQEYGYNIDLSSNYYSANNTPAIIVIEPYYWGNTGYVDFHLDGTYPWN